MNISNIIKEPKSIREFLLRRAYRKCRVLLHSSPDYFPLLPKLGIINDVFLPIPVNCEYYSPKLDKRTLKKELVIFHPANLDWRLKGNNIFLEGVAKYLELRSSLKPIFLKFIDESGLIIGQLLAFQSFKGKTKIEISLGKGILSNTILKIGKVLPKHIRWSYGPIIFEESYKDEIIKSFSIWLKSIRNFHGLLHPLDSKFDISPQFNFNKKMNSTFIIDLRQDIETIFKKTNKNSVQKNIRRSEERGVTVTSITSKNDLIEYYNLQKTYREANDLHPYHLDDIIEGFNLLGSLGYHGFIARLDDVPIGAISFSSFNGYINESGIARTEIDYEKKLYSQDLLRWKIIEWSKEHDCKYYDLSGIKLENQTSKEKGIFHNKKKWGGKQMDLLLIKT